MSGRGLLRAIWQVIDGFLAGISGFLQKTLRVLNLLRVLVFLGVVSSAVLAVLVITKPVIIPYVLAAFLVLGAVPMIVVFVLLSLPFRAKSAVRLIRMGYPDNAKEMTIRLVARKMRDQSIETEQLLFQTAWNESRKLLDRYRRRADKLKRHLDDMPE